MDDKKRITGRVEFEGVTYSRALHRFVEKRVSRWLQSHVREGKAESAMPAYSVTFRRQGEGHMVNCNLEISWGLQSWVSFRYGSSPQDAVDQCLQHLNRGGTELPDEFLSLSPSDERRHKVVFSRRVMKVWAPSY